MKRLTLEDLWDKAFQKSGEAMLESGDTAYFVDEKHAEMYDRDDLIVWNRWKEWVRNLKLFDVDKDGVNEQCKKCKHLSGRVYQHTSFPVCEAFPQDIDKHELYLQTKRHSCPKFEKK